MLAVLEDNFGIKLKKLLALIIKKHLILKGDKDLKTYTVTA